VVPVWGASALIVIGARLEPSVIYWLGLLPVGAELTGWVSLASQFVRNGLAFAAVVLVTAFVYYFAPNRPQSFAHVSAWRCWSGCTCWRSSRSWGVSSTLATATATTLTTTH
jgi:hypothetical protein